MNKTHVKTNEKRQRRENKISKILPNNHRMPHRTSSTRNDNEQKINYDWPKGISLPQTFCTKTYLYTKLYMNSQEQ